MALELKARPSLKTRVVLSALMVFGLAAPLSFNLSKSVAALDMTGVIINEFSSFASSDWVELYNPTDQPITMLNWTLRDSSATQFKPVNGVLAPKAFMVIEFSDYLNKDGDTIKLYNSLASLVDEVVYAKNAPIPAPQLEQSAARIPDGGAAWVAGEMTKGTANTPDRQAPTISILQPGNGELFGGPGKTEILVRAQITDNKSLKTYHMSLDGIETMGPQPESEPTSTPDGIQTVVSGTVPTGGLSEQPHVIAVWAVDEAGNVSNKAEVTVVVDRTAPSVTITNPTSGEVMGGDALILHGSVTDPNGIREYRYQLLDRDRGSSLGNSVKGGDQAVENSQLGVIDISQLPSDDYYVRVWATDTAGNTSSPVYVKFVIDHLPPSVTMNLVSSSSPTASTPIQLQGEAGGEPVKRLMLYVKDEEGSTVFSRDITKELINGRWQYSLSAGLSQGSYTLSVVATDHYGNNSTIDSSPLSVLSLSVGPYAPPTQSTIPTGLTADLDDPFFVPAEVRPVTVPEVVNDEAADILGIQDNKSPDNQSDKMAVAATESGWRLFGILWYWWLLGAGVAGGAWWTITLAKRQLLEDTL